MKPAQLQAAKGAPNIAELDRICARILQAKWASGSICLLAAPRGKGISQLIHVGAQGHTENGGRGQKINKDTLFDVGALTQCLATANVMLMLMGQGRVSLASTLGQCLAEAKGGPLAECTLGALLDHSAGLPPGDAVLDAAVAAMPAPARPRVLAASEQQARVTVKVPQSPLGVPLGKGPLGEAQLQALKKNLCKTTPVASAGTRCAYAPLGPLLVSWALEALSKKPFDVLMQQLVVKPLLPVQSMQFCRNGPSGALLPPNNVVTSALCPWRHRALKAEAQDPLAWLLGGVAGHSGLFASGDGAMRLALGLLFSLQGVVRYAHAGTLQRLWTRSTQAQGSLYTPGWMAACRDNNMLPGRWHSRTVGQIDASGSAVFIDPAFGLLGVLLVNAGPSLSQEHKTGLAHVRARVFDAMASYGQNLAGAAAPKR